MTELTVFLSLISQCYSVSILPSRSIHIKTVLQKGSDWGEDSRATKEVLHRKSNIQLPLLDSETALLAVGPPETSQPQTAHSTSVIEEGLSLSLFVSFSFFPPVSGMEPTALHI